MARRTSLSIFAFSTAAAAAALSTSCLAAASWRRIPSTRAARERQQRGGPRTQRARHEWAGHLRAGGKERGGGGLGRGVGKWPEGQFDHSDISLTAV